MTTLTSPTLNVDTVCLQKGLAFIPGDETGDNIAYASTVQGKIMQYGYMLNVEAFSALRKSSRGAIISFCDNVMDYLKFMMGGKEAFKPLYGDFPLSVMPEDTYTEMLNAMSYFSTHGTIDGFVTEEKEVAFEKGVKFTVLKLARNEDIDKIFTDLVSVNQSLTPLDLDTIKWFVKSGRSLIFPETIPFKENLCVLAGLGVPGLPINTPTDVLRIAVYMSGGDISLPAVPPKFVKQARSPWKGKGMVLNTERDKFKFKKWTRAERRYIMGLLESTHCDPREMVLKDQRWIKLAHGLHSGEYGKKFPRAATALHVLRNGKVRSWYSKLETAFKSGLTAGLNILSDRPGEFVRRISWLLTKFNNIVEVAEITQRFKIAASAASNKVLFELLNYLERRRKDTTERYIMIKGGRKKIKLPGQKALEGSHIDLVQGAAKEAISYKFRKLEPLGKVWIDPELSKIPLPSNMRSLNPSLKPQIRGQRMPIQNPNAKVVRAFYHWTDEHGTLDPDLSATFVGESVDPEVLAFSTGGLRVGKSVHSGDIIARKGACAEYVDIDVKGARSAGFKYVTIDVRNYRGGSLAEMNGVFGLMERENPQAGKTWVPDTIAGCMLTSSKASNTLLSIIDLETMEYIFLDVDSSGSTAAADDTASILEVIKQYAELPKFSVAHLLEMHVEARGELVDKPEEADKKFEFDEFCHDYVKTAQLMGI